MRNDLTDVTLIVDRSGSMAQCKAEAEGGVNLFIEDQKKQAGECNFTLIQFDTNYDTVCNGVPIKDAPTYTLKPRGWTALLDAVGRAINEAGARLAALPEDQRPGLVVIAITTDGQENSSKEFNREQIRAMVEHQQSVYSWKFTFLGANQNSFLEAGNLGIQASGIADYSLSNTGVAFRHMSDNVSRMRGAMGSCGPEGAKGVACCYTEEERKAML